MNKDWTVVPDIHGRKFWRSALKGREDGNIVFLGDYLDPYPWEEITPGDSYRELRAVIEFKRAHMDNVVLLMGNHDLGYLDPSICGCRRDVYGAERNRRLLLDNLDLFELAHVAEADGQKVLFTHAGIRESWVRTNSGIFDQGEFDPTVLNTMLHDPERRDALFAALSQVSEYRGGYDPLSSPVWTDAQEFIDSGDFLPGYLHVFGHTLHRGGPILIKAEQGCGWCMDCAEAFRMDHTGAMHYLDETEKG